MPPSIAEMMAQSGLQSSQEVGDFAGSYDRGVKTGAALAQSVEGIQESRAKLEMEKQKLQMQKATAVTDTLKIAMDSKDPKLKNFLLKNVMPGKIKALGMEEFFNPATMELLQTSEAAQQKLLGLQLDLDEKIRSGQITGAQAYEMAQGVLSNPEELAMLDTDRLYAAQEFAKSETGKGYRAFQSAQAALGKQVQAQQAAGGVAASQAIGREYADYQAAGGKATMEKNFDKLEEAAKLLESGKIKTGKLSAAIPLVKNDDVQDVINPDIARVRDDVRGAVQASLRQTLGAQFTAQEGEAIFNRAFNPRLSGEENARRIRTEIEGLKKTMTNKEAEFAAQGYSVKGSAKKEAPAKNSSQEQKKKEFKKLSPEAQKKALPGFAKYLNMSIEEVKKELGIK